jgi:Fungal specific transcription factor domain
MIVQEPQGAVTNSICALAGLHHERMRIAQGLQAPDSNLDHSYAKAFHNSAYYQLVNAKRLRGHYNENDAIAALHLVSFSLFSGGTTDWRNVLTVALDWLGQTPVATAENPRLTVLHMGFSSRCALKMTMVGLCQFHLKECHLQVIKWLDILSSITLGRPPKYLTLYRRLLARCGDNATGASPYWMESDMDGGFDLRMESLSGCSDDVMLAIAEISALAHWKDTVSSNRSLSVRQLVRRGEEIEQRLRAIDTEPPSSTAGANSGLPHPNLPVQPLTDGAHASPDNHTRRTVANIFREAAILYLQMVVNGNYPSTYNFIQMRHFSKLITLTCYRCTGNQRFCWKHHAHVGAVTTV